MFDICSQIRGETGGGRETGCKLPLRMFTTRVSDLLIKERLAIGFGGYITENLRQEFSLLVYVMSLLACGSIHQGHERFKGQSREKQCSSMSLSALLNAQNIPVIEWNTTAS